MLLLDKRSFYLIVFLFCFSAVFGQENNTEGEKKEPAKETAAVEPEKKAPPAPPGPPWWTRSAMVNLDNKLKAHLEGEIKYTYQTGTLDSHLIESTVMFALRKNRFTNFFYTDIGFMDAKQHFAIYVPNEAGEIERRDVSAKVLFRKFQFVDIFRTDFTKNLFLDLGWEGFRDDMSFIRTRHTYFAGLGYQFDVANKHHYSFIGGLGWEETEYTPRDVLETRGIPSSVVIEDTPDSAAVFFQYKGMQQLNPMISFHQSFFYTYYLEEERNDRWELKLRVMFRLNQSLSMFTAFEAIFEDNKTSNAAGGEKLNTKLVTGMRFSF